MASIGAGVLAGALQGGDALASWMVDQAAQHFGAQMQAVLDITIITNPFVLLFFGAIGLILGAVQWLLAFLRQAAILVEAGLLLLAASGSLTDSTKVWLNRLLPSLVALVVYKPIAALIYTIGFTFIGDAKDVSTAITGLMVIMLACVAMPALLRLFSWAGVSIASGSGGGMSGAVGAAALAGSMARHPAVQQASYLEATGPEPGQSDTAQGADPSGAGSSGSGSAGPEHGSDQPDMATAQEDARTARGGEAVGGVPGSSGPVEGGGAAGGGEERAGAAVGPAGAVAGAVVRAGYQASQSAAEQMAGDEQSDHEGEDQG